MSGTRPGRLFVYLPGGSRIKLGAEIGSGAAGVVYGVPGRPIVVKLYRELTAERTLQPERERRLRALLAVDARSWVDERTGLPPVVWPLTEVLDRNGRLRGFAMARCDSPPAIALTDALDAEARAWSGLDVTWEWCLRASLNLAFAVDSVHRRGMLVADASETNVFFDRVTARALLIDCDSFELRDPESGEWLRFPDLTPATAAPELLRSQPGERMRNRSTDVWALCVLVAQLLLEGQHPFLGVPVDAPAGGSYLPEDNVRSGRGRFGDSGVLALPSGALAPDVLPSAVRERIGRCFGAGLEDPGARPSASGLVAALLEAHNALRRCERSDRHVFAGHLRRCPWCERVADGFGDPFPVPGGPPAGLQSVAQRGGVMAELCPAPPAGTIRRLSRRVRLGRA